MPYSGGGFGDSGGGTEGLPPTSQVWPDPNNTGGGQQAYPGPGDGGGTLLFPVSPGNTKTGPWDTSGDGSGAGYSPPSTHHGRHSRSAGHHKVKKVSIWHAPAHPSHRRVLAPGVEDQTF